MKKRKIEKIIREDIRKTTPDVLSKIDLDQIEVKKPAKKGFSFQRLFNKKTFAAALSLSALAVLLLVVLLPGDTLPPEPDPTPREYVFEEKDEITTLSAFSAVTLLHQSGDTLAHASQGVHLSLLASSSSQEYLIDTQLDTLTRYLHIVEPIVLGKDNIEFALSESPREDYEYQMLFTSLDLRGQEIVHTLHFNETEIDEDEYYLEGIMNVEGVEYHFDAELEFDEDGYEIELTATHPTKEDTYVTVKQEIEGDEQTFEYEHVLYGETVFESELTIEFEDDEIVIELEYEDDEKEVEFYIVKENNDTFRKLRIEYEIDTDDEDEEGVITLTIVFDAETQRHQYRYAIVIEEEFSIIRTRPYRLFEQP